LFYNAICRLSLRLQSWFIRASKQLGENFYTRLNWRSQGGFNRSSQHFSKGGCDEEVQAFGSECASKFATARPASRGTARELQTVLDGDCLGALERGCCG
jgi:hypothetical protein